VAVQSTGDISAESVRGQKVKEHVVTDLDLRNDENRPSLTSGPVAERQEVSSRNTTDEMADTITGDNDSGLWSRKQKKWGKIGWKVKQVLFDIVMKRYL